MKQHQLSKYVHSKVPESCVSKGLMLGVMCKLNFTFQKTRNMTKTILLEALKDQQDPKEF